MDSGREEKKEPIKGQFGKKILAKDSSRRYWKKDHINGNDILGASVD